MVAPLSAAVPAVAASQTLSHGIRQVRTEQHRGVAIFNQDRNSEKRLTIVNLPNPSPQYPTLQFH